MDKEIGLVAGKVWAYLNENGSVSIYQLCRQLKIQERLIHMALGWLAREDKLAWETQGRALYVNLKEPSHQQEAAD